MNSDNPGKPLKPAERIRCALERVRDGADSSSVGGYPAGSLPSTDKIVLALFKNPEGCRQFQRRLLKAGIMSTLTVSRRESRVAVDREDCRRALPILEEQLEEFPDHWPDGVRRDHDFLILGTFIGVGLSFVTAAATFGNAAIDGIQLALGATACTVQGALIGQFIDIARGSRRSSGKVQWGMRQMLLLFTILILFGFLLSMF